MNFSAWNVRGLNKRSHQKEVDNFIRMNNLSFVGLLETKVKVVNFDLVTKRLNKNWHWINNLAHQYNGRIIVGWDSSIWRIAVCSSSAQHITCMATFLEKQINFCVTFIYAFNYGCDRTPLWTYLKGFQPSVPWCVLGDFNCVTSLDEIKGGREHWTPDMQTFKDCISDAHLDHASTVGDCFTWVNNRPHYPVTKRLDRALINSFWMTEYPSSQIFVHNRGIMDHSPIIMQIPTTIEKIKKAFQFFNFMFDLAGFEAAITKAWSTRMYGDPMAILCRKLKLVKGELIALNKSKGNIHVAVNEARALLHSIQNNLKGSLGNTDLLLEEQSAVDNLDSLLEQEESLLSQKARCRWLQLGDGNNAFFFNQTKANWTRNKMLAIKDKDGILVNGHKNVAKIAVHYFQNSIGAHEEHSQIDLSNFQGPSITEGHAASLISPVTNELIWTTLKKLKKKKAPGPDGFNVEFYIRCWHIIGEDFCRAVIDFFRHSNMHHGINSTSIALIPKTASPSTMQEFRPISLCTVAYKCISKILASRLQKIMPHVTDKAQSAFIKGRLLSDNVLLAQELFRGYGRETGLPKCALKIDLHKAFDSVRWPFVIAVLHNMNFPRAFIRWVEECITTPMYSIRTNGALSGYFPGAKGLRQGDPMSPYLFALVMNVFSCILNNAPTDFKHHWRCKEMHLTHLFFADDVLLFSRGDRRSIQHIMDSLDLFSSLSGLKPSISKSTCFFNNCNPDLVEWFNSTYGIPQGTLPVCFLGVPLITTKLSFNECMPLIQKLTSRISSWVCLVLSFAGRLQLIKAVLFSVQAFWTNHFLLPKGVHKHMQQLFTRFLWKGDATSLGGAKVSWNDICLPKEEGGLGIKSTIEWNHAQILTHLWKVATKSTSLWASWVQKTVLKTKNFWAIDIPSDCSWIWKKLLRLRTKAKRWISYRLGSGASVSLWYDPWWNHHSLACNDKDRIILSSGLSPTATVHDIIDTGQWVLPRPNLNHHHVSPGLLTWLNTFDFPNFNLENEDSILWDNQLGKNVSTGTIWGSIRSSGAPAPWHGAVWFKGHIPRYAFLNWLLCHDRVATLKRLASFGIPLATHCSLCVGGEESAQHLFVSCAYSSFILARFLGDRLDIHIDFAATWEVLLLSFLEIEDIAKRKIALLGVQIIAYHIWRERNARTHDKGNFSPKKLLDGILIDLRARLATSTWYSHDVIKRPILCTWIF